MSSLPESSTEVALTPAQRMALEHTKYHPAAVEDIPDEDAAATQTSANPITPPVNGTNGVSMSEKAARKQKATEPTFSGNATKKPVAPALNITSDEAFPSLGPAKAPSQAANNSWGPGSIPKAAVNGSTTNGSIVPPTSRQPAKPAVQLPSVHQDSYLLPHSMIKTTLNKSLAETLNDVARGTGVKLETRQESGAKNELMTKIIGSGRNPTVLTKVLRAAVIEVGKKGSSKVQIRASSKALLIGKGGSTIKEIQEKSGAKIQLPPATARSAMPADDDEMIEVTVEGDPLALSYAEQLIKATVGSGPSEVRLAMQNIPPELYPFLSAHPEVTRPSQGMRVSIPPYTTWLAKPPAEKAADFAAQEGLHINLAGPSEQARKLRAELDAYAAQLQQRLQIQELIGIEREKHQFVVGPSGMAVEDFLKETGCSLILPPPGHDDEIIYVVGPPEKLEQAMDRAAELSTSMSKSTIDVSRSYQGPKESQAQYMRNLARYMGQRRALESITAQHNAQVAFPADPSQPWTLWHRDVKSGPKARADVLNAISAHPHNRFKAVNIDPFYQRDLERQHARQIREQHGVHVVIPKPADEPDNILLVYEGPGPANGYNFPQKRPSAEEVAQFEKALLQAEQYLMQSIGDMQEIIDHSAEVPSKYREKAARKFVKKPDSQTRYPVEFRGLEGTSKGGSNIPVTIRGPQDAVQDSVAAFLAFIEEQINDEGEREYTTSCPFPKAFRGRLIGKDGETINKIRSDFDVDVKFKAEDDRVEIQGPPKKAEAAKQHIMSMARKAEDETTHTLTIPAKYHGEIIGKGGNYVKKLQDRYSSALVFFPAAPDDSATDISSNKRRAAQGPNEVVVKGSKKHADAVKDELMALYFHAQENSFSATVSVAQAQVPALIGRNGIEAKELREDTGADIEFPKQADALGTGRSEIVIKGTKEAVQKAKKALEDKIKTFDQTVTEELSIDKKFYRSLIGSGGDHLRQLVQAAGGDPGQSSRIVQIPRELSTEQTIKIMGPKDVVDKLAKSINNFVGQQESRTAEIMEVAPDRHGALIGARGAVKKGIESDHNVVLLIPQATVQGAARSQVKIVGQPSDVAAAKQRITSILAQGRSRSSGGPGETVEVPVRLHHVIADGGKFFSTLKKDLKVTVDHNKQRPPPKVAPPTKVPIPAAMPLITDDASSSAGSISGEDITNNLQWAIVANTVSAGDSDPTIPWVLKGDVENVAQAKQRLEAAMTAAENSVTGYLTLPEPRSTHGHVVGPAGATIRKIRETTGCNPRVPPSGEVGAIELSGERETVEAAKAMIVKAVVEGLRKNERREQRIDRSERNSVW